jgi:hypothetical protein
VEDKTGGIFISLQTDLGISPRSQVRVTGTLADSSGLLVLVPANPSAVRLLGVGPKIFPVWVAGGLIGEATEGLLVRVVGAITVAPSSDLPFGYKFTVDDGTGPVQIFVNTQTGIAVSGLALGETVSVAGFSSQFETHYEIDPRSPADIEVRVH